LKYATTKGAWATLRFTGSDVAWVAPKDTNRGKADVYLDNIKVATIDLNSTQRARERQSSRSLGLPLGLMSLRFWYTVLLLRGHG
jgi:hypothetical protein